MDVPILVAIISVGGTLLGTVVGGTIAIYGNAHLAKRRERLEFRTACRLVAAELQDNSFIVEFALEKRLWWRSEEELTTEEWKQYKSVLAAGLPDDALADVKFAVRGVNNASLLAAASRPLDKPDEIFSEPTVEALTLLLKNMKKGRVSLMPYLL
jgi:hypothetical protein